MSARPRRGAAAHSAASSLFEDEADVSGDGGSGDEGEEYDSDDSLSGSSFIVSDDDSEASLSLYRRLDNAKLSDADFSSGIDDESPLSSAIESSPGSAASSLHEGRGSGSDDDGGGAPPAAYAATSPQEVDALRSRCGGAGDEVLLEALGPAAASPPSLAAAYGVALEQARADLQAASGSSRRRAVVSRVAAAAARLLRLQTDVEEDLTSTAGRPIRLGNAVVVEAMQRRLVGLGAASDGGGAAPSATRLLTAVHALERAARAAGSAAHRHLARDAAGGTIEALRTLVLLAFVTIILRGGDYKVALTIHPSCIAVRPSPTLPPPPAPPSSRQESLLHAKLRISRVKIAFRLHALALGHFSP